MSSGADSSPLAPPAIAAFDHGFRDAFLAGMRAHPKSVPCKFFYDERGSRLFERICLLPEYYQTRSEFSILSDRADEIAAAIGRNVELIEFGAGALTKVRLLLNCLESPSAYIPVDISGEYLSQVCAALARDYPGLRLVPVIADFSGSFVLPAAAPGAQARVGFFPGSTIGNFGPAEAVSFLRKVRTIVRGGGLLIGADLVKDPRILHAAYNDSRGVTEAFNKNLLLRANRELGANFDLDAFAHYAFYDPVAMRIEMHLMSRTDQTVRVEEEEFSF
ncbi:MAG: L-histidine N(alpha)-methyltransferase, partial [Alphaproteobacteria bacterium]|nr:L-histidine N(alpha)-methyltransferase [Alphaproteobacteria bacterium]